MKNKKTILLSFIFFSTFLYAKDLTLMEAYNLALSKSNKILSSKYVSQSRKEDINQTKAALYPQLSAKVSYGNRFSHMSELINKDKKPERERSLDYTLSLRQSIYDPELYSKIEMEKYREKLFSLQFQKDKQKLFLDVFKSYIKIFRLENIISLLESKTMYFKYANDSAKKKYKMNLMNKMDMLRANVDYNTVKIKLKKEKQLLKVARNDLKKFTEIADFSLPSINYNINIEEVEKLKKLINNEDIYLSNLVVQEAKITKDFSKSMLDNAFDAHLPKLSFDANYTKYYSHDRASDYEDTTRYMVVLNLPLYSGGYTNSKVKSSKLKYSASIEDLKLVEKEIKTEIEEYRSEFNAAFETLILYKTSLESANLYLDSIKQAYDKGLKSIIDLYEAKNKLDEIKLSYVDNLSILITSYAQLLKSTNSFESIKLIDNIL